MDLIADEAYKVILWVFIFLFDQLKTDSNTMNLERQLYV